MIEGIALIIGLSYIGYLFFEKRAIAMYRSSFTHVIHVTGTRGKTTVTRMIGHMLRTKGVRVMTKVSGTIPTLIDTDGQEHIIRRFGPANIREQMRMMRRAYKEKADVLVIECMAVREEYVRVTQHEMLHADHVIITNVRKDHLEDPMSDQVRALQAAVPKQGKLFIGKDYENLFLETAITRDSALFRVETIRQGHGDEFGNASFAKAILTSLGYEIEVGPDDYVPDIGAFELKRYRGVVFVNAFSVNDRTSFEHVYERLERYEDLDIDQATFLINNRADRPKRALDFLEFLKEIKPKTVYVAGPFRQRFKRVLKTSDVRPYRSPELLEGPCVIGIGNIKSTGYDVIRYFREGETIHG